MLSWHLVQGDGVCSGESVVLRVHLLDLNLHHGVRELGVLAGPQEAHWVSDIGVDVGPMPALGVSDGSSLVEGILPDVEDVRVDGDSDSVVTGDLEGRSGVHSSHHRLDLLLHDELLHLLEISLGLVDGGWWASSVGHAF